MRRLLFVCMLAGCPSDPPPDCKPVEIDCAPAYVPTFNNVYENTLKMGCGSTKSNCHSRAGRAGGLSFETEAIAHEGLLAPSQGRVIPGDPSCSELIVRVDSPGEDYQMPPDKPLSEAQRCALILWVLNGAEP